MLDPIVIENLTLNQVKYLTEEDLQDSAVLQRLLALSDDAQVNAEPGAAKEFYENLNGIMSEYESVLESKKSSWDFLLLISLKLFWKALSAIEEKSIQNMVSTSILSVLKLGLDLREYFERWLSLYEDRHVPEKEIRRKLAYAIENNEEKIGMKSITFESKDVQPTVQNWLKDYNEVVKLGTERGKFEEINYFNTSPNVKTLSSEEREVLSKLIELYDWILFPPPGVQVVKEEATDYTTKTVAKTSAPVVPRLQKTAPQIPPSPGLKLPEDMGKPGAFPKGLDIQTTLPTKPAAGVQEDIDKKLQELKKKLK